MKHSILCIYLIFLSLLSFADSTKVTLRGKILQANSDSLLVLTTKNDTVSIIELTPAGEFLQTFELKDGPGIYYITDNTEYAELYLKPGYDLKIFIHTKKFDETLSFRGTGQDNNNYLIKKYLLLESLGILNEHSYQVALEEQKFARLKDSIYDLKSDLLSKYEYLDEDFKELAILENKIERELMVKAYNKKRGDYLKDSTYKSKIKPDPELNPLPLNTNYFLVDGYSDLLLAELRDKARAIENGSYTYKNLVVLSQYYPENPEIGKKMLDLYCEYTLGPPSERINIFTSFKDSIEDGRFKQDLESKIEYLESKPKSAVESALEGVLMLENERINTRLTKWDQTECPDFEFSDIEGNSVTLDQFKGKFVYIDIWATWCKPCIAEMPDMRELQKHFADAENLVFLSMSIDTDSVAWAKMVKALKMNGVHVYHSGAKHPFFESLEVNSIPRFILIDPEGMIISGDALRPSDENTAEYLEDQITVD